jgi:DNA-binding XRE family transcriptional regulator
MAKPFKKLTDDLERRAPGAAERIEARAQGIRDALALSELRETRHLTQTQLANALHVTQSNVSRIERQEDLYLSTLAEYVHAMGGALRVVAVFDDDEIAIGVGPRKRVR